MQATTALRPFYYNSLHPYNDSPLIKELSELFLQIPDEAFIESLKTYRAGRRGYTSRIIWHTIIAMYYLHLPSFSALIRALQDNPALRFACGIATFKGIPSPWAYSRFMGKLAECPYQVQSLMNMMTHDIATKIPDFGKIVAIDATHIKAFSNGGKKSKFFDAPSDPDAGWVVKKTHSWA